MVKENAHKPLVDLIRSSRSTTVQVKAASAVEALATNNAYSQKRFLDLDAPKALIRLLKVKTLRATIILMAMCMYLWNCDFLSMCMQLPFVTES